MCDYNLLLFMHMLCACIVFASCQMIILGLPPIRALNLLMWVDLVEECISWQYPKLFSGLGTFEKSYIMLNPNP